MKILILCADEGLLEKAVAKLESYGSNAIIGGQTASVPADSCSVAIVLKGSDSVLDFQGKATSKYTLIIEEKDTDKEVLQALDNLYNDKVRYGSTPCVCGANDVCKCH